MINFVLTILIPFDEFFFAFSYILYMIFFVVLQGQCRIMIRCIFRREASYSDGCRVLQAGSRNMLSSTWSSSRVVLPLSFEREVKGVQLPLETTLIRGGEEIVVLLIVFLWI